MAGEKIWEEGESSKEQEPALSPIDHARVKKYGQTGYKSEYALLAYKCLANSSNAKTKSHICSLLQCSKPTLLKWMKQNPEFHDAITDGLEIGKVKWRNKIAKHAWQPSSKVNNGLIKLLSASVYGIKEEADPSIIINNNVDTDPNTLMKNRGIPIPDVGIEDIDE